MKLFLYRTSSNVTASIEDESNIVDREDVVDSESSQSIPASSPHVYSPPPIRGKIQPEKGHCKESSIEENYNCNNACTIPCMVKDPVINKEINTVCYWE